jgi:rubrerythrin
MDTQQISKEIQETLLPIMKEHYDGYGFSIATSTRMYNSNMCLYFLSDYIGLGRIPIKLMDVNIASDYSKLGKMLDLCVGDKKEEIIQKSIVGEGIVGNIVDKFNPAVEFTEKDMVSMLYYLGYLTIKDTRLETPVLGIPNKVMKQIYSDYFLNIVRKQLELPNRDNYEEMTNEMAFEGKIDKIIELLQMYLQGLSNRDYQRFDEKYVKLIFYCITMNLSFYRIKSEMEVQRRYPDVLLLPKRDGDKYFATMIEFKYLKKGEEGKLAEKQEEAVWVCLKCGTTNSVEDKFCQNCEK